MRTFALFGRRRGLAAIARRQISMAAAITGLAIAVGLLEGAGIGLLIPFLSTFSNASATPTGGRLLVWVQSIGGADTRNERLVLVASFILACLLLKACVSALQGTLTALVYGRVGHDIRCALSAKLQGAPYSFFLAQKESRLVNIIGTESWRATDAVRAVLTQLGSTAVVLALGTLLLLVSWRLSLVVLLGALLPQLLQRRVKARLRLRSKKIVAADEGMLSRMLFAIYGARLIRLFHTQALEQKRFTDTSDEVRKAILNTERLSSLLGPSLEVSYGLLFLAVLLVAVFNGLSVPVLVTFLVLMNRLQPHLRNLEEAKASLASMAVHFDEIEWLLSQPTATPSQDGQVPFHGLRQAIAFQDVSFGYPGATEPVLSNANLVLHRGRSVALIGPSGAGKSTVINLLCRLLEPTAGAILVDGQPLSALKTNDWLNSVAVAGQDLDLMDGTVAENIAYGRPATTRREIEAAARDAQAHFLNDLPLGLDTVVGSRGLSLSGGQRQRIGLARALARKPDLLILDEATNAVDVDTEENILETIKLLPAEMTILVVSHRPTTLAFCDDAIVLERGQVARAGSLQSILADAGANPLDLAEASALSEISEPSEPSEPSEDTLLSTGSHSP